MMDFDYYVNTYLGTELKEREFNLFAARAKAVLEQFCRDFIVVGGEDARAMAVCAMAEALHRHGTRRGVASANVGGVSVRYMGESDRELTRELYRKAQIYLDIYRGVRHASY